MSRQLVDENGVNVAAYAGPGGAPMVQVLVDDCIVQLTRDQAETVVFTLLAWLVR